MQTLHGYTVDETQWKSKGGGGQCNIAKKGGKEYFIKGRMSSGFCILMDIEGNKISFENAPKGMKTPKLSNCIRIEARKSWIVTEKELNLNT